MVNVVTINITNYSYVYSVTVNPEWSSGALAKS